MSTRTPPKSRRPVAEANPWGLTAGQMRIMNRLLVVQNQKLVALTVELSERTVEAHLNLIRRKMRERFTLGAALKFQRWRLEQQEQARNAAPLNNIRALTEPA